MKIIWEDDFSVIDTGGYGEKLQVLPIEDEPMAFCLLRVQMLYHKATRNCSELRTLN